jgi:choline dehydrogenase
LKDDLGYNRQLRGTVAKGKSALKYLLTRKGPLATATGDVMAFFKTQPDADRVDAQLFVRMMSIGSLRGDQADGIDSRGASKAIHDAGITFAGEVLRPTSRGSVWITSANPEKAPQVDPNYLATDYDRKTSVGLLRKIRQLSEQSPLAELLDFQTSGPAPELESDSDLVEAILSTGVTGNHATSTCAMGPGDDDIVDDHLRVRGVDGLRIVDASIMPTIPSGNNGGPMMAMAGRAAELILDSRSD